MDTLTSLWLNSKLRCTVRSDAFLLESATTYVGMDRRHWPLHQMFNNLQTRNTQVAVLKLLYRSHLAALFVPVKKAQILWLACVFSCLSQLLVQNVHFMYNISYPLTCATVVKIVLFTSPLSGYYG